MRTKIYVQEYTLTLLNVKIWPETNPLAKKRVKVNCDTSIHWNVGRLLK